MNRDRTNSELPPPVGSFATSLFCISVFATMLVPIVALTYSYNTLTAAASGLGFVLLVGADWFLWAFRKRSNQSSNPIPAPNALRVGLILGLLWAVEIGINNFAAPPLPARDHIDNLFWGVIAVSILVLASMRAFQAGSLVRGIEAGTWSGFVSGLVACCAALAMIVFGMRFILSDPVNIAEWAGRGSGANAPTMAAYFAFETFAGAFGHLIVLGIAMGALLGLIGGGIGKCVRWGRGSPSRLELE